MAIRSSIIAHAIIAAGLVTGLTIANHSSHGEHPDHDGHDDHAHGDPAPYESPFDWSKHIVPADMNEAVAEWMQRGTPGEPHSFFHKFVGDWEGTMRVWMDPSQPPQETAASATYEMVLGGRFLRQRYQGSIMGRQYEGVGYNGYDNLRKRFTMLWMDSISTTVSISHGSLDPQATTMTCFGEMDEPMTGEIGKPFKLVTKWIDADTHVFETWEVVYGKPFKVFEIEYRRKD